MIQGTNSYTSLAGSFSPSAFRATSDAPRADAASPGRSQLRDPLTEYQNRVATADTRPSRTPVEQRILAEIMGYSGQPARVVQDGLDLRRQDFVAVRSAPDASLEFSGGVEVFQTCGTDGSSVTYFSGESSGAKYKACAVMFGPNMSAERKENMIKAAVTFTSDHLNDRRDASGNWNRSLIESFA